MVSKLTEIKLLEDFAIVKSTFLHTEFGESLVEGVLTTFEAHVDIAASPSVSTFVTSATGLAESRAWSTSNTLSFSACARVIPKVVH